MFITNCISLLNEGISENFLNRKAAWFVVVVVVDDVLLMLLLKKLLLVFLEKLMTLVCRRYVMV